MLEMAGHVVLQQLCIIQNSTMTAFVFQISPNDEGITPHIYVPPKKLWTQSGFTKSLTFISETTTISGDIIAKRFAMVKQVHDFEVGIFFRLDG